MGRRETEIHTHTCLPSGLGKSVDTSREEPGEAGPKLGCEGGLLHPPPPSGDAEPPRGPQERAIATLNDSGSERRPPDGDRESGTGVARSPDLRSRWGSERPSGPRRGPSGAPAAAPEVPGPRGSAGGAGRLGRPLCSSASGGCPELRQRRPSPSPAPASHAAASLGPVRLGGGREAPGSPAAISGGRPGLGLSPHPHGLRSGRGPRGAAARRHV